MVQQSDDLERRDANKCVIRDHFERGVSRGELEIYDLIMDEDYMLHVGLVQNALAGGLVGYKAGLGSFQDSFPDMAIELLDLVAEDDMVVAHYIERGTHTGTPHRGHPANGRAYQKHGFGLYRLHGGRMVEGWVQEDDLSFLRDMGWT